MDHKHQHVGEGCSCAPVNREVHQTMAEMEFERGIWTAAMDNDFGRVERLVKQGKVNAKDNFGYTALHYAARSGSVEMCELLLRSGAEIDSATKAGGVTAVQRAAMKGRLGVVQVLVQKGGANLRLRDADGKTALHRAVEAGHLSVVNYLLARDPSLADIVDNQQKTPRDAADSVGDIRKAFKC